MKIAFIIAAGALVYAAVFRNDAQAPVQAKGDRPVENAPPLPTEPVSVAGLATRGSETARVVMIEYSDFECPFCMRFARETLPELDRQFIATGKVRLVFRHLPLGKHRFAQKAAEAAECAGHQGKFWPMHDRLFLDPKSLADEDLRAHASALGLDSPAFETCQAGLMADRVQSDSASARLLGVTGTPAFFIGTVETDGRVRIRQRLKGAQPIRLFAAAFKIRKGKRDG